MISKQLLADLERRDWKRRLRQAILNGLDLEGPPAVHDAIAEIVAELGIKGTKGTKRQPVPENVLRAGARYLGAVMDGRKPPTLGEMRDTASAVEPITRQGIRDWKEGDRWAEVLGLALAQRLDKDNAV